MSAARKTKKSARPATAKKRAPRSAPRSAPVEAAPRIGRLAKGKKPQYFGDPAIDKLLWMTLTLMEELAVTRDRLDTVERLLSKKRLVALEDIERFKPDAAAAQSRAARREAFVERALRAVQADLEAVAGREMPQSEAEILAAVDD